MDCRPRVDRVLILSAFRLLHVCIICQLYSFGTAKAAMSFYCPFICLLLICLLVCVDLAILLRIGESFLLAAMNA